MEICFTKYFWNSEKIKPFVSSGIIKETCVIESDINCISDNHDLRYSGNVTVIDECTSISELLKRHLNTNFCV